ncbi:TetR family transcriptional regulator [Flavivirga spongiicola]|uniref:Biofilm operon icaADBC HTH-type negative transcriptional regulator IcaR n=1 Tax=Flavivirga spongiicola TaxID=421621 RepID=A0ABU7XRP0_9FLAO|nr:TetR family transcriptional regulator [Flavivirga sp. MEBiC05379]MDO5978240.1 TetR family transcriptional regulator [Flavivirga sp. MEBiC05379]
MGRKSLKTVRQKEIIKSFYEVAKQEGLENSSVAKVAKHMGINTSLILHYFESKDELMFGLINHILESYKQLYVTNDIKDSELKLKQTISNLFSRDWNNLIDDGVFYSCYSLIFRDKNIKEAFKNLHDSLRDYLTDLIVEAKKEGIVNVENPKETAELIFVLVEGAYYYLSLFDADCLEHSKKAEHYKNAAIEILNFKDMLSLPLHND